MGTTILLALQVIFEQSTIHNTHSGREYELMNSGKRYRVPLCKYNRYRHSFIHLISESG